MSNAIWAMITVQLLIWLSLLSRLANPRTSFVAICHNSVWAGAIFLIGTDLIRFRESSVSAWLTLILGLTFFNLGAVLAPAKKLPEMDSRVYVPDVNALVSRRTLGMLVLIYGFGFAYYLYVIGQRFGLGTLLQNPESIRATAGESYLESVPFFVRILLYLGPVLFVVFGYNGAVDRPLPVGIRGVALLLLTGSMLALLQRTNLFMGVLWLVAMLLMRRGASPPETLMEVSAKTTEDLKPVSRRWLPLFILGLTALIAFQAVAGFLNKTGQQALSTGVVSTQLRDSGLTSIFGYYTSGTVAFLQLTDSTNQNWPPPNDEVALNAGNFNPQTWGAATFAPVLKAIPLARPWDPIEPFIDTGILTNVYTWLAPFYRDFRVTGVVVGMLLMGGIAGALYGRRFESSRMFWLQAAVISTIFLAPFITKINNTLFIAEIVFVLLLTTGSFRPRVSLSVAKLNQRVNRSRQL